MKKINLIILSSIFLFAIVACGSEKTEEEKAEEVAENIIKNITGNDVDIDVDEDGETGTVTIKGKDGEEVTFSGNENELPDDLPSDVYVIDGDIEGVGNITSANGKVVTFGIKSKKSISDLKDKIEKEMKSEGWKTGMNMSVPESAMLNYTKGKKSVTITIGKEDDGTVVSYMVSFKK